MRTWLIYKSLESAFLRCRASRPRRNYDQFSIGLLAGYGDAAPKIEYKESRKTNFTVNSAVHMARRSSYNEAFS